MLAEILSATSGSLCNENYRYILWPFKMHTEDYVHSLLRVKCVPGSFPMLSTLHISQQLAIAQLINIDFVNEEKNKMKNFFKSKKQYWAMVIHLSYTSGCLVY